MSILNIKHLNVTYTPIHANLFEINAKMDAELIDNIYSYEIDMINKTLKLHSNTNEEYLKKIVQFQSPSEIEIIVHDKHGKIILKRRMENLTYLGYSTEGDWGKQDLLFATLCWRFEDILDICV